MPISTIDTKIIIAEDHFVVRNGLKKIIESKDGLVVIGEAEDGKSLINLLTDNKADLLLLDLNWYKPWAGLCGAGHCSFAEQWGQDSPCCIAITKRS